MAIFNKNKHDQPNVTFDSAEEKPILVIPRSGTEVVVERTGGFVEAGWIVNETYANDQGILVTEVTRGELVKTVATERLLEWQQEANEGLERQRQAHLGRKVVDVVEADGDVADFHVPITIINPSGEQPPRKI